MDESHYAVQHIRQNKAENGPDDDLQRGMPDQFHQAFRTNLAFPVHFIHHLVENGRLLAGGTAYSLGVEHGDHGEHDRQGKEDGIKSGFQANGRCQRGRAGGMAGGHAAGADKPLEIEPFFADDAQNDFGPLGDSPHHGRNDQHFIIKNGMHVDSVNSSGKIKS